MAPPNAGTGVVCVGCVVPVLSAVAWFPQRDSAQRANHSATALNEQPQRDSAQRAAHSATALNEQPTARQCVL